MRERAIRPAIVILNRVGVSGFIDEPSVREVHCEPVDHIFVVAVPAAVGLVDAHILRRYHAR